MATKIKFNKYHVTDGKLKARVWYALDNRTDGRKCVTIYAKDYTNPLHEIFANSGAEYKNDTDLQSDYHEKGRIVLFEDNPLYVEARKRGHRDVVISTTTEKELSMDLKNATAVRAVTTPKEDKIEVINYLYDNGLVTTLTLEDGVPMTDENIVGAPWTGSPDEWVAFMEKLITNCSNCSEILAH